MIQEGIGEEGEVGGIKMDTVSENGCLGNEVVIEAVGIYGYIRMDKFNGLTKTCHAGIAVIVQVTTIEMDRIALFHMDITKGFERITGLIEVSAVAIHPCTALPKGNITAQHLRIRYLCFMENE
jgi:hypothetical protein